MPRFDLKDAAAIVTGGSRGIGPHIASALAQCGARVALVARSEQGLEATARTLTANKDHRSARQFRLSGRYDYPMPSAGRRDGGNSDSA